jgi:multicomponent K+:H+ antiporter subunit A
LENLAVTAVTSLFTVEEYTTAMNAVALIVAAPCSLLLGAVLQILVARLCSARTKGILALLACLPAVVSVAGAMRLIRDGRALDLNLLQWDGPLSLVLHVDALSLPFRFMGRSWARWCCSIPSVTWRTTSQRRASTASMLIFIGGFIGLVYSANLFFFYLCWEAIGLCSFSLVGFWYTNREAVPARAKFC